MDRTPRRRYDAAFASLGDAATSYYYVVASEERVINDPWISQAKPLTWLYPDEDLGIVILVNGTNIENQDIADAVAKIEW